MREKAELSFNGLMLEKLVLLAAKRGVVFDKVKRATSREATLITDKKGADELLRIAREYSLDIRLISSRGPGAAARRAKSRWTLFAAFIVVGCLAMSFLSRIWIIDINMLDGTAPDGIITALEEMGISPGVSLGSGGARKIQSGISARCAKYAYVGASVRGVTLTIEATQTFPIPDVYDLAKARDIVSAADATVLSVDALAGTPMVKPGQTVRKGDVLISGTERDTRETTRRINARGSVIGRIWLKGEAQTELAREEKIRTGRESVKAELRLWDYSRTISDGGGFDDEQVEEEFFPVGGIIAPLGILKTTRYEVKTRKVPIDIEAAREQTLAEAIENALRGAPDTAWVYEKWTDSTIEENGILICRALVEMRLDIARD